MGKSGKDFRARTSNLMSIINVTFFASAIIMSTDHASSVFLSSYRGAALKENGRLQGINFVTTRNCRNNYNLEETIEKSNYFDANTTEN